MKTSGWRDIMKKYKLIPEDIVKNMIDFLDEYQFDAAKDSPTTNPEALHKINFCNWMINELLNSNDGFDSNQVVRFKLKPTDDTPVEDKDWDKIIKSFDSFFKGWDIAYKSSQDAPKENKKKPKPNTQDEDWKPRLDDVSEYCSLEEIEEFLKDDPELTDNERFELYYEERERIKKKEEIEKGFSLDDMCKDLGIKRNPGKKK
tara:strand:+ start:167 stop:775 length:609 start_codon:yes stop_codon:yes gene_type:complete